MDRRIEGGRNAAVDGLALLLSQAASGHRIIYGEHRRNPGEVGIDLSGHPFGLKVRNLAQGISFVGKPGVTRVSVNTFAAHLGARISEMSSTENLQRFRIVRVPVPEVGPDAYELYFEVDLGWFGTIICGGCNNFSGEGGDGGRRLTAVLELLAATAGRTVEVETVSNEVGAMGAKMMQLAYTAHYEA